jgi:hypothetical protein
MNYITKNRSLSFIHYAILLIPVLVLLARAFFEPPWTDEVFFLDPGAQLAFTGRMISSCSFTNSSTELWASSNPGIPLMFAGWFKLFGFGKIQAKLLFCFLNFFGIWLFFRWIIRRLSPNPWAVVIGVSCSVLLPSLNVTIVNPRLEVLAFIMCAWFLRYSWDERNDFFHEWVAAPLLGIAIIFFGLHFAPFFALAAITTFFITTNWRTFRLGLGLAIGLLTGLILLRAVYVYYGVWDVFTTIRLAHLHNKIPWALTGVKKFFYYPDLVFFAILSLIALLSTTFTKKINESRSWVVWAIALASFFVIPQLIDYTGFYYKRYIWMVGIPVILCFFVGWPHLMPIIKKIFASIIITLLGFYMYKSVNFLRLNINQSSQNQATLGILRQLVPSGSSIVADQRLYYELISEGFLYYPVPIYPRSEGKLKNWDFFGFKKELSFSPNVSKSISAIVITETESKNKGSVEAVGGQWKEVARIKSSPKYNTGDDVLIFTPK